MEKSLTEEQINKVHQLEFFYMDAAKSFVPASDNELYSRVMRLDENLRRHAKAKAISEGIVGFLLLITGFNLLTMVSGSFLAGIIFFCIGAINLALSYPLYNMLLSKSRRKYAPVVLTITEYLG